MRKDKDIQQYTGRRAAHAGKPSFFEGAGGPEGLLFLQIQFFCIIFPQKTGGHPYACYFFAKEVSAETIAGKYPPYSP
jgi:hypothetical protein